MKCILTVVGISNQYSKAYMVQMASSRISPLFLFLWALISALTTANAAELLVEPNANCCVKQNNTTTQVDRVLDSGSNSNTGTGYNVSGNIHLAAISYGINASTQTPPMNTFTDFSTYPNYHLLPTLCECGYRVTPLSKHHRVRRVTSGVPAGIGNYPWMVQVLLRNSTTDQQTFQCGGTLISKDTVLTAAHCMRVPGGNYITHVAIGAYKVNASQISDEFLVEIEKVIIHEDYININLEHDLALVKLKTSIDTETTESRRRASSTFLPRPICLPTKSIQMDALVGQEFEFVGWGRVNLPSDHIINSNLNLNRINMTFLEKEYCSELYGTIYGEINDSKLCALGQIEQGICNGDSGSPLMKSFSMPELNGEEQIFQLGIASSFGPQGIECGRQGLASTFTSIAHHMPWILNNLNFSQSTYRKSRKIDKHKQAPTEYLKDGYLKSYKELTKHPNFHLLPDRSSCGVAAKNQRYNRTRAKRMTGGRIARPEDIPGVALIYFRNAEKKYQSNLSHITIGATGTFINSRYILTTAFGVRWPRSSYVLDSVRLGDNSYHYGLAIEEVIMHPRSNPSTASNDVALLRLAQPVQFTSTITPVCLPVNAEDFEYNEKTKLVSVGWGNIKGVYSVADERRPYASYMEAKLIPRGDCDRVYSRTLGKLQSETLCGKSKLGDGSGECGVGDFGAALMRVARFQNFTKYTQIGLASHFTKCGISAFPTVYMNTGYFLQWILDNIEL